MVLKILLVLESLVLLGFSIRLLLDYLCNYSYVRDVFLVLASFFAIAIPFVVFLGYPIEAIKLCILGYCLFSTFVLSNVKTAKVKWFSNIFKALISVLALYTLVQDFSEPYIILSIHIYVLFTASLNLTFTVLNNNSLYSKITDGLCGLGVIFANQYLFSQPSDSLSLYLALCTCQVLIILKVVSRVKYLNKLKSKL